MTRKEKEAMDRKVFQLRSKETPMLKVIWKNQDVEAPTWETEASMKECYLELVQDYLAGNPFPPC